LDAAAQSDEYRRALIAGVTRNLPRELVGPLDSNQRPKDYESEGEIPVDLSGFSELCRETSTIHGLYASQIFVVPAVIPSNVHGSVARNLRLFQGARIPNTSPDWSEEPQNGKECPFTSE
jgi:hypothetical protein